MAETKRCGEVIMVPHLLQGHVNPMMHLAKKLLKAGLSITTLIPVDQQTLLGSASEMEGFNVQTVIPVRDERNRPYRGISASSTNFGLACEPFFKQLLEKESQEQGPKCIIADQFVGWTQEWADKLHIPRYAYIVSPASYAYIMYNDSSLIANGILDHKDQNPIIELPGIPVVHLGDLGRSAINNPQSLTENGDSFGRAAGILFNTFYELEASAIDAFHEQLNADNTREKATQTFPIGPMLPEEYFSDSPFESTGKDAECIRWLTTRPAASVLYVAFGSSSRISPPQILELAHALDASQVSFLWVLQVKSRSSARESVDVSKLLPPDFLSRTKDRGLVYFEFAPQLEILSHPATGGFLTHCGWNSSLESICRGVPMIGWPMGAEQKLCFRILVDLANVAIDMKENVDGSVDRFEIERAVKQLMSESAGRKLRERALELRAQARTAVGRSGSSYLNFERLVKDIQGSSSSKILPPR